MTRVLDQGWRSYGAQLETDAAPYDPWGGSGDANDSAIYIARPGVDFLRPWLAIPNGVAFQWPLGLEGYNLTIDPSLGIHKFVGDNKVSIDVLHAGEEHFTMSGTFPGNSSPDLIQALRDVVYLQADERQGKLLYVPEIFRYAQRVQVNHAEFGRGSDNRGRDATYSIEFVRIGTENDELDNIVAIPQTPQPTGARRGSSSRSITTTASMRTARQVAAAKLGSASQWRTIYNLNETVYLQRHVPLASVPDFRLTPGIKLSY